MHGSPTQGGVFGRYETGRKFFVLRSRYIFGHDAADWGGEHFTAA